MVFVMNKCLAFKNGGNMSKLIFSKNSSGKLLLLSLIFSFILITMVLINEVKAEHFFQQYSTWYQSIPADPKLNINSTNHVNDILLNSNVLAANRNWSPTVWKAIGNESSRTIYSMNCAIYGGNYCNTDYWTYQKQDWDVIANYPKDALPAQNTTAINCFPDYCHDGKMVIISADGQYAWDIGGGILFPEDYTPKNTNLCGGPPNYQNCRGKLVGRYIRKWNLKTDDGVNYPYDGLGGATFAKVPLLHGLITYAEIKAGEINHALAFAYNGATKPSHQLIYPSGVYAAGISDRQWAMKGGERLFLDQSVDCESMKNNFAKIVCRALKKYGMIFMENDGPRNNSIYIENTAGKPYTWSSMSLDISGIPLNKLKVAEPICSDCSVCPNCSIEPSPPPPPPPSPAPTPSPPTPGAPTLVP